MTDQPSPNDLRAMIRETVREAMQERPTLDPDDSAVLMRKLISGRQTQRWEYLFVRTSGNQVVSINWARLERGLDLYEHFTALGLEGWELVCFADEYDHYIFKRPVIDEGAS